MAYEYLGLLAALALSGGVFVAIEVGRRVGGRRLADEGEAYTKGVGPLESAVFALLGLLLAFSFSGALSRFDDRRQLIAEEANDIGTAWLRIQLLPADAQGPMRELFRQYLDSRLASYSHLPDFVAFRKEFAHTGKLQGEIWSLAISSMPKGEPRDAFLLVLPALNAMFDIATTRAEMFRTHTPPIIFWMLGALGLACALFAGYDMALRKRRNLLHSVAFAVVLSVTVYVIIDIEYPRFGLIRNTDSDQVLIDLRKSMD